jgi:hypothetical protein
MTLREAIARLDELPQDATIYAESTEPTARAVVAVEPEDGSVPDDAAGLVYFLEVALAREAVDVWRRWRPGRSPSVDDRLAAVTYYAANDAWLPLDPP